MTTTISPLPKQVENWARCRLLHTLLPVWDGDYRYDALAEKYVKNIRYICAECDHSD